jgi:hypothetical protein
VRDALRSYQFHDQPAVLRAALVLLPRTAAALREALSTPRGSPAQAVRRLIASPEDARVLGALPWLLTVPTLRGDADAELRRAVAAGQWPGVLGRWPVLLTPAVRAAVRKLAKPEALLAAPHAAATMPVHAAIGLCHWLDVLRLPADEAVRQYGGLRAHGDRRVRLAALRRLLAMPAGPTRLLALQAIEPFCEDDDAVIARTALRALIRHRWPDLTKLLMKLVNSPHESVRRIAGRRLAPLGFDRLWHVWRQLTAAQRIAAGRALIKISDQFHQQLARKIESPDRKDRVRALTMIAQLNQGAFFAGALIELAHDRDERIAATAVAALGSADGISECRFATANLAQASHAHDDSITKSEIANRKSAITETLEWATHHADARVRANAVESLSKLRACRDVRRLTEMAGRDDPRPRANAIMALLDMRMVDSLAALHAMLHDDLPAQRISALWLVENMGILNVAEDVAEMSVDDADPGVRQRARRVIEHLIQHMRSGAAAHAPGPAGDAAEAGRIGALDETRPSRERLAS